MDWQQLTSNGYVLGRGFLSEGELASLRTEYASLSTTPAKNNNYDVLFGSLHTIEKFESRFMALARSIQAATGIEADVPVAVVYFSTRKVNFENFHQDHESYYLFQDHSNYLNLWIPIIKPDPNASNLSVIPFDALRARAPELHAKLVGRGASTFVRQPGKTVVFDDENGTEHEVPLDLAELAITPALEAGDLLLMRGDLIHRTEDVTTERVAVSFRRAQSKTVIKKSTFAKGGPKKRQMIANNPQLFGYLATQLEGRDEITVGEAFSLA
jgi:hypothetical protein